MHIHVCVSMCVGVLCILMVILGVYMFCGPE